MNRNRTRAPWITQTAVFLALLIALQALTRPLGNTFVTGSLVNLMLVLSVLLCGFSSAAALSVIAPVFALLIGISPMWPFVPFVAAGNLALVLVWHIAAKKQAVALVCAAAAKFLILFFGITVWLVPLVLKLPEPQAGVVSAAYAWPQLVTAVIGGLLASLVARPLRKALKLP